MRERNIYKTTVIIIVLEILIKIIGFIKQSIIANFYGADAGMDTYFIASDFINGFSNIIINSAKIGIVAVYTSVRINEGKKKGNSLIVEILEILIPIVIIVSIIFDLFSLPISKMLAPMFRSQQLIKLSEYISFFSWIILISVLCMVFDSILNSHEIYYLSRARSFIYSSVTIVGSVFFSDRYGISVLLYAQYLALILYLLMQVFGIRRNFHFQFKRIVHKTELKAMICMIVPALVGNSMVQINYWVDNAVASSLPEGAISALSYSHVLDDLFVGVFITTVASIILPHFSNLIANNDSEQMLNTLDKGLNFITLILIPISLIAFFCSTKMIEIAFFRGKFSKETVTLTSLALKGYVLRYSFVAIRDISIQSLYAFKNTRIPMINAIICTIINIIISVIFSQYWGIVAISFGTTISAVIGAMLNANALKNSLIQFKFINVLDIYIKSFAIIIVLVILFCLLGININTGNNILDIIIMGTIICSIYYGGLLIFNQRTVLNVGKKIIDFCFHTFSRD